MKKAHIIKWGKVERSRPGLVGHPHLDDEPAAVSYTDFRFWIRLTQNPGFNLPLLGYWSHARGKAKKVRI